MTFGERLRMARKHRKMTQKVLAAKTNLGPSHISTYENDDAVPSLFVGAELARALGVSLTWLATGKREKPRAVNVKDGE